MTPPAKESIFLQALRSLKRLPQWCSRMEAAIPLWVEGNLLWITHLSNRSTCSDVIKSILKFRAEAQKPEKYRVVERWKRVERRLPSRCKILKIWHAWGEQRKYVRFLLRKNSRRMDTALTNTRSPVLPLHGKRNPKYRMHKSRSSHSKIPNLGNFEKSWDSDLEKFRTIVSTQKQILNSQRQKLLDKDEEIDHYETMIHLNRVEDLGENYLQNAYLGEDEHEGSDADVETQLKTWPLAKSTKRAIREATELYERILEISERIEKQEDYIRVLSAQIRHSITLKDHSDTDEAVCNTPDDSSDENLEAYLYKTKIRIECLAALNRSQTLAIEHNDRTLREYNKIYEHKCRYLKQLENDLDQADIDTRRIQQRRLHQKLFGYDKGNLMRSSTRRRTFSNSKDDRLLPENNNSDTGLSSLHSSSDECGNILDTLV